MMDENGALGQHTHFNALKADMREASGADGRINLDSRVQRRAYSWQSPQRFLFTKHFGLLTGGITGKNSSVDWPFVIRVDDKLDAPMGKYYMYYSSDHAGGGISLAYADDPLGPFTIYQRIFRFSTQDEAGTVTTYETETPSVIWDGTNKRLLMFWHGYNTCSGEAQTTWRMTSADGITWDAEHKVKALDLDAERLYGNLHNGYFLPFRVGDSWFAYSLMGGESGGSALHWSEDGGYCWHTDHRKLGRWSVSLDGMCLFPHHGTIVFFQGQYWFLGIYSNIVSGANGKKAYIAMAAIQDLRTVIGSPLIIVRNTDETYESVDLRSVCTYCENGTLYVYYSCVTQTASYINCAVLSERENSAPMEEDGTVYLARYDLAAPAGQDGKAVPDTLSCIAGGSAAMQVSGSPVYSESGIAIWKGMHLFVPTFALDHSTPYCIHVKYRFPGSIPGSHRLLFVPTLDFNVFVSDGEKYDAACLKYENSTGAFTSFFGKQNTVGRLRSDLDTVSMDITVSADTLTVVTAMTWPNNSASDTLTDTFTCSGLTDALMQHGLYIGNREADDRAINATVEEFFVVQVSAL